ncbi:hypothetical protein [Lysinibacillus sphaericus]|uniref:Uncharacterized protein n=1 Tax=Lysinibacillus sphaericus TaxID=1421 RepID=A0A6H0A0P1_LYSSH|nr:hypothetical protein [Lysinibacillus sphaericus]QIS31260.1 hypothetical protein [Lysinibacillus sphaericus]QPA61357.1 hypothetical protein INQ55_23800 [Lysinibacillus sphaericus]
MGDANLVITTKNCETRYLPYKTFHIQDNPTVRDMLNEIYSNKENIQLSCSCNPYNTSMVLSKSKSGRFFIKSKPHSKSLHFKCEFAYTQDGSKESTHFPSIYSPELFFSDRDNNYLIEFDLSLNLEPLKRNTLALKLSNLGLELLARAWDYLMDNYMKKKSHYYPDLNSIKFSLINLFVGKKDYHKGNTITPPLTSVKLDKNINLEDILYLGLHSTAAIYAINKRYGVYAVVLTSLYNSEISEHDEEYYLLTLSINNRIKGKVRQYHRKFIMKKTLFKSSVEKYSIEQFSHLDNFLNERKVPYYLIGLAKSDSYANLPELVEIALIPVNYNGVIVRNIEELRFTNLLCVRRRIFKKPISRTIHYNNIAPSFILYDSIKPTICEVIVDTTNSIEKIEYFNNQTDFLFYAWFANKYTKITENIPDVYINE